MANETTLSTLDDLIVPMIAEALFVASEASIMRNLVRNYTLPKNSGKVIQVPIYPVVAAAAVAEATDLANTAISTSKADLTVSEVGVMTTVTDMAVNTAESDVIKDLGKLFGEGIARKIDADLMLLFDGFSGAVGAADAAITVAKIFEAVSKLKQAGVPSNDMSCVLHPAVAYDLKANMTNTFANPNPTDLANEALRTGFVGQLAGVNVYESSNMANTGTGGDFKGGLFHKDALGLAMLQDIKIETQRDASIRGTEIVATAVYGVGELHDSYGIEVLADSSIL
jgi:N4-gp56 family major capsid protein